MKRSVSVALLATFLCLSLVTAGPIKITQTEKGTIVIAEMGNPAVYILELNNSGAKEKYEVITYAQFDLQPKGKFDLYTGNNTLEVKAFPRDVILKQRGNVGFQYQLFGQQSGLFNDIFSLQVVSLKDALEVTPSSINPSSSAITFTLKNTQKIALENIPLTFSSQFFEDTKTVALLPLEEITVQVPLKFIDKTLLAGSYMYTVEAKMEKGTVQWQGVLQYTELENIKTDKLSKGVIIRKTTNTKTNEGNVPAQAQIEITKNMLTRLFTIHSIEPVSTQRKGLFVTYTWQKQLVPTEVYAVTTTTNYTFPFILIILIIVIAVLVSIAMRTALTVQKKVSFVKTKGGEFALKATVRVKAHKSVDQVSISEHVPQSMQLYEKFSGHPHRVDKTSRSMHWDIPHLNAGEERVYSYIMFSKVHVVGHYELPLASVTFTHNGKQEHVSSNRAIFMSETLAHAED